MTTIVFGERSLVTSGCFGKRIVLEIRNTVKDSSEKPVKAEILLKQSSKERPTEAPFGVCFMD
jgi:hypothetical protein